ncbi:MAG TPA: hypothetical protein VFV33_14280 [Gemmatimonadaceae bacterium]|nr:hypothetical protein [Gemmatimonadaceae bacterium]
MTAPTYADLATIHGETRAYADLPPADREWWDTALSRAARIARACDRLTADEAHYVIHCGGDADLDDALTAQESALIALGAML